MSFELTLDEFDGSHCIDRVASFGGNAAIAGAIYGSVAAAFMTPAPHPKPNIIQALGLVSRYSILIGSAGALFAGSTCALASVREKDDYINWAFGGALAGSIFGMKARNIPVGLGWACALGTLGAMVKYTEVYKDPLPRREMP
ncbi:NADH dehydrogenase [ubiquinone] 1 alpha subcomplex subunit 11-like [Xenia sp. Carnegie-2017]|uniref:NADH dehydrogenase [ubiquinone] 1 alpha subcomplex subunit 11-like n=1 Tax=Xenia sp. Carnegie-2017 TaxID=2897299 RepID=UPI001F0367E9|nr:NADH dehydrogenase [ubiquinone] 1 alpha subcomplex subunit 11-like [Xenia sp. Carnegie-2017]